MMETATKLTEMDGVLQFSRGALALGNHDNGKRKNDKIVPFILVYYFYLYLIFNLI
jgi:hypothetical protein